MPRGGRFLQKDIQTNKWNDIGDQKAKEKTSQALREGAPEIRTELERGQKKTDPADSVTSAQPTGYPKPGKLLPNGLITLNYEGVFAAQQRCSRGPIQDGTIDINNPITSNFMQQPLDPMMQAFQQFQAGYMAKMGQQLMPPSMAQSQQNELPAQSQNQNQPSTSALEKDGNLCSAQVGPASSPSALAMDPETKSPTEGSALEAGSSNLQLAKRNSGDCSFPSAPSGKGFHSGMQSQSTIEKSLPGIANPPSTIGEKKSLDNKLGIPLPLRDKGHTSKGEFLNASAPTMTQEMALQILLHEKAQKAQHARKEATSAEAQPKTLRTLPSLQEGSHPPSNRHANLKMHLASSSALTEILFEKPAGQSVANLGKISSMSDESIREMLRTLKQQAQPSSPPPAYSSATVSGLVQAPYRTSADALGATNSWALDALGPSGNLLPHNMRQSSDLASLASQYSKFLSGQRATSSISLAPSLSPFTSFGRNDSLGLQQAIQDTILHLGSLDKPALGISESLGSVPLRSTVSAMLAQMKGAGIYKHGTLDVAATGNMSQASGETKKAYCASATAIKPNANANTIPNPVFGNGAALNDHVKMTSTPRRGCSGSPLDHLHNAAGLCSPKVELESHNKGESNGGLQRGGGVKRAFHQPFSSDVNGLSKKMKIFQGMMDTKHQASEPQTRKEWASAEWENVKKASSNAASGLKLGKNDQSLVDDSDEEIDHRYSKQPDAAIKIARRVRQSSGSYDQKRTTKRNSASIADNCSSNAVMTTEKISGQQKASGGDVARGTTLNRGVSFSRDKLNLPITETTLVNGFSLALSEISLDRGQSTEGEFPSDDGQFDDAEHEDEPAVERGRTIGTIHTFYSGS